ncbi:LOW QUALITY PROTEIN: uncharacterized protein LOC129596212 [Paramacrobiotus metropolitanus]|uniref:LOW QUALITY PROTEIN: uncharacterized protein LOC129596212 n=1 Tax=Paramacrobiotus metropolitanus TaxID=2943436 RepID=UPI0024457D9D|nr:LOW QUALITY PROTEIN: uncharacterized protein LOC129596212 [Paramacrobiotus metropolitanus]
MKKSTLYLLYYKKYISLKLFVILRRRLIRNGRRVEQRDNWTERAFRLENCSEKECWDYFRFRKDDIPTLRICLKIPDSVVTATGDHASGIEALCILLRRLAYPNRWIDLRKLFGRSHGSLSRIFYATLNIVDIQWKNHLSTWDHDWLSEDFFALYATAIAGKGGIIPNVFGFIDGTARPICRPSVNQEIMYSGHKRFHCTKWQSVVLPNGLICSLSGGQPGTMHDSRMFRESGLLEQLEKKQRTYQRKFILYDEGYGNNAFLRKPFSKLEVRTNLLKRMQNNAMKTVRESVEWGFKEVVAKFAFVDFKKQMALLQKPINKMFIVAVLLTNCINCMYPNEASQFFDTEPPTLQEYLQ